MITDVLDLSAQVAAVDVGDALVGLEKVAEPRLLTILRREGEG